MRFQGPKKHYYIHHHHFLLHELSQVSAFNHSGTTDKTKTYACMYYYLPIINHQAEYSQLLIQVDIKTKNPSKETLLCKKAALFLTTLLQWVSCMSKKCCFGDFYFYLPMKTYILWQGVWLFESSSILVLSKLQTVGGILQVSLIHNILMYLYKRIIVWVTWQKGSFKNFI